MALLPNDLLAQLTASAAVDGTNVHLGQLAHNAAAALAPPPVAATTATNQQPQLPSDVSLEKFNQMWEFFKQFKDTIVRRPIEVPIRETPVDDAQPPTPPPAAVTPMSDRVLLRNVPQSMQQNAQRFVNYISRNRDIQWDADGNVWLNGQPVRGANMANIVRFISTKSRVRTPPAGTMELTQFLASTNIPRVYIQNPQARDAYVGQRQRLLGSQSGDTLSSASQAPVRRQLQWSAGVGPSSSATSQGTDGAATPSSSRISDALFNTAGVTPQNNRPRKRRNNWQQGTASTQGSSAGSKKPRWSSLYK